VETEIGTTLREARIRHKVDLAEIEERTKIRVRYLRALENEEWDLLPGPTYTRSFIRTYANFLGLDGERLADDFRRQQEALLAEPGASRDPHVFPSRARVSHAEDGSRIGPGMIAAIALAGLVAIVFVIGIAGGSGDESPAPSKQATGTAGKPKKGGTGSAKPKPGVSIRLTATSEVWVCALAADGSRVVDGEILEAGSARGPFRSGSFDLAFGNGSVDLKVNGKSYPVEDTPSPIGYRVNPGKVSVLPEGSRPDCT
jgi:cytoskeletal protein RodZ